MESGAVRRVHETEALIEAPNWSPDGRFLIVNGAGCLYRFDLENAAMHRIDTGFAVNCNNDHGISPDGALLALCDKTETGKACIYTVPVAGGTPRRITDAVPSWWHGWSPDGARLVYTAIRDEAFCICALDIETGAEARLVGGPHHYDGPDYTADGRWIWFNSDRGGTMQLWRMRADGSALQQMSDDERVNWFPHPAPHNRTVLYLAYPSGTTGHPRGREVELRAIAPEGGPPRTLVSLFGGQGTINVPCWAPDGRAFAFMRYAPSGERASASAP